MFLGRFSTAVVNIQFYLFQHEIEKIREDNKSAKEMRDWLIKLFDVLEDESDAKRLREIFENMRYEKYIKDKIEQSKSDSDDNVRQNSVK